MNRRIFLGTSVSLGLGSLLAACASTSASLTPAAIVADAQGIVNGLAGLIPKLAIAYPTLLPPALLATIQKDLGLAQGVLGSVSANVPATVSVVTVQSILGYVNDVLNILADPPINGLIPSPFNSAVAAAAFLAPALEAFVASYLPGAASVASAPRARVTLAKNAPPITNAAQALAELAKYAG